MHVNNKDGNQNEEIILFKESTLQKCREVFAIRQGTNTKYRNVVLPSTVNSNQGYHVRCYKTYTAVPTAKSTTDQDKPLPVGFQPGQNSTLQLPEASSTVQLRSSSTLKANTRTGILEEKCIFCKKKDRKHKGVKEKLVQCQTKNIELSIRNDAKTLGDVDFLGEINAMDFVAKEAKYHQICRVEYANRAKEKNKKKTEPARDHQWHIMREAHKNAFTSICSFIDDLIVKSEEVHLVNDVYRHYISFIEDSCETDYDSLAADYKPHHLLKKITEKYGDELKVISLPPGKGVGKIIFKSSMSAEKAILKTFENSKSLAVKVSGV